MSVNSGKTDFGIAVHCMRCIFVCAAMSTFADAARASTEDTVSELVYAENESRYRYMSRRSRDIHVIAATEVNQNISISDETYWINDSNINGDISLKSASSELTMVGSTQNGKLIVYDGVATLYSTSIVSSPNSRTIGGIVMYGGNANLYDSSITGKGTGAIIYGGASTDGATLSVDHSSIHGETGSAIVVYGVAKDQVMNINVTNQSELLSGNGKILEVTGKSSGQVNFTVDQSDLKGDIYVYSGATQATLNVSLQNGSSLEGAVNGADSFHISRSEWDLTGDSVVGDLIGDTAVINTADHDLNISSLSGSGSISSDFMRVVSSPPVQVAGNMDGVWQITVADTQHNYADGELQPAYVLVEVDGSNSASVSGKSDIGAYQYTTTVDSNGEVVAVQTGIPWAPTEPADGPSDTGGEDTSNNPGGSGDAGAPTGPVKPALNDGATAAVDALSVASTKAMWDTQFGAVHLRQQALREFAPRRRAFWVQGYGGEYQLNDGYGAGASDTFDTRVSGMSIGVDALLDQVGATRTYGGVYASYVEQDRSASGSYGNSHGYSVGLYGVWQHDCGWYLEGMAAFGSLVNRYSANYYGSPSRSVVNANDWKGRSSAIYMETGKQFTLGGEWRVQPAVGVRMVHQNSQSFSTDVGHFVSSDGVNSAGAQVSVTLSKRFRSAKNRYELYARLGYAQEFASTQTVRYAGAPIDTNLDASRAFVNVGLSAELARRHALFADVQYQKGRDVENTYLISLGYQYAF
ncbi:protein of unknown function [Pararobbsia alpina]